MTKTELEQKIKEFAENIFWEGFQDGQQYESDHTPIDVEDAYQRGLNDAWECTRKIILGESSNGYTVEELIKIFDSASIYYIFKNHSIPQIIEKIKKYEESELAKDNNVSTKIEVGDVIKCETAYVVVTWRNDESWNGMLLNDCDCGHAGGCYTMMKGFTNWHKTGKHYSQIVEVLSEMKGETE